MSSEVTLPLAAALTDLATRRLGERTERPEQGAADTMLREDRVPFGSLVRNESAPDKPADKAPRRRQPQAERLMPGQLSSSDKAIEAKELDRQPKPDRREEETATSREAERPRGDERPKANARRDVEPRESVDANEEPSADTPEIPAEAEASAEGTAAEGEIQGEGGADAQPAAAEGAEGEIPVVANPVTAALTNPTLASAGNGGTAANGAVIDADAAGTSSDPALAAELAKLAEAESKKASEGAEAGAAEDGDAATLAAKSRSPIAEVAEAAREARPETGKQGIGEAVSDAAKGAKGAETPPAQAKPVQPELHPTRAPIFAEMLESFHGSAIHRPADILAGLDRTIGAGTARAETASRPTPLQMLPIEIGMQAVRGATNFQIRLDPAELGRIDVKLQIKENGEVYANLVVDRVETLAMLRRDASTLQQAFEQAGLRQSADGLSFSLRGEGQRGEGQDGQGRSGGRQDASDEAALNAVPAEVAMRRVLIPNASIDRMI